MIITTFWRVGLLSLQHQDTFEKRRNSRKRARDICKSAQYFCTRETQLKPLYINRDKKALLSICPSQRSLHFRQLLPITTQFASFKKPWRKPHASWPTRTLKLRVFWQKLCRSAKARGWSERRLCKSEKASSLTPGVHNLVLPI